MCSELYGSVSVWAATASQGVDLASSFKLCAFSEASAPAVLSFAQIFFFFFFSEEEYY